MEYPVHERFLTFQGEGVHMGRRAFFIRLMGCPVHCPWCDSAGTWHKDWIPPVKNMMSVAELVLEAAKGHPEFVVITGGEPAIHDLHPLMIGLNNVGLAVHLETSGSFAFCNGFEWVTVSPKKWKMPLVENVRNAHEIKIIVEQEDDIVFYLGEIDKALGKEYFEHDVQIWLHPEWSKSDNFLVLNAISEAVVHKHTEWKLRAGYQLHKLFRVDAKDARAAKLVPLGGNPVLGF